MAINKKLKLKKIYIPREIDVLISSYGGVGTTFFISFVSKYKKTLAYEEAYFKHIPLPPLSKNNNLKVIYIFGNPQNACISLFRRNYQNGHSTNYSNYFKTRKEPIPKEESLIEYLTKGIDKFRFEKHFLNWSKTHYSKYEILFLKYETLHEHIDVVFDYLELPSSLISEFPKKIRRKSNLNSLSKNEKELLDKMYLNFSKDIEKLDPYFLISNYRKFNLLNFILSKLFYQLLKLKHLNELIKNKIYNIK